MLDPEVWEKSKDLVTAEWSRILWSSSTAVTGCVLLAAGLQGYLVRSCSFWQRGFLVVAALGLITPGFWTDTIGATLTGIVIFTQLVAGRHAAEMVPKPGE
jgi:TRAP-type uncharacterized transport system fused permease subunit